MGTVSRVHTFSSGAILTAAQLNNEFDNLLTSSAINGGLDATNLGVTAGQATASKALVVDGSRNLADGTAGNRINNLALSGTFESTGGITATAGITSGGNIVSDTDSTDDLGTTSVRWANLYADSIGDSGQALAVKATTLSFDAASTIDTSGNNNLTLDAGTATLTLDAGTIESDAGTLSFDGAASIDTSGNNALAIDTGSANLNVTAGTLALTGAQTISSTLGVTGLITASGGVSGALTGNVTGNISGNVTGGTISGTTGAFSSTLAATGATTIGAGQAVNAKALLTLTSTTSAGYGGEIQFHKNSASTAEIGNESAVLGSGTSSDLYLASDGNIDFAAGGTTQRMTLASTGLDVNGIANGNSAFKVTNAAGNKTSEFEISGSGHGAAKIRNSSGAEKISLSAYENSHITAGYNFGVGTMSPAHTLVVKSTADDAVVEVESSASNSNPAFRLKNDAQEWQWQLRGAESDALVAWDVTGEAGRLYIDTSGNVSIGTSSVFGTNLLNVNGGIAIDGRGAATPGLCEKGDVDTGVYWPTTNTIGITNGGSESLRVDSSRQLLVGYTSSQGSYKLQVNSQIFATNATVATSDGRYKEDVQTLSNATDLVSRLKPVQFKWKAHEIHNLDVGKTDVGFIAQEVQAVLSDADYRDSVVVSNKTNDEEYLGLGETKLIPLLTAAIQELTQRITELENN